MNRMSAMLQSGSIAELKYSIVGAFRVQELEDAREKQVNH